MFSQMFKAFEGLLYPNPEKAGWGKWFLNLGWAWRTSQLCRGISWVTRSSGLASHRAGALLKSSASLWTYAASEGSRCPWTLGVVQNCLLTRAAPDTILPDAHCQDPSPVGLSAPTAWIPSVTPVLTTCVNFGQWPHPSDSYRP